MGAKVEFFDRVLARIDRLDRESVQGYVCGLVRERKKLEELLDEINEGIVLLTLEGAVRFANRRAHLWLGFQRFLKDRSKIEELVEEPLVKDFIMECLKKPMDSAHVEVRVLTPREMYLRIHSIPFETEGETEILLKVENLTQDQRVMEEEARLQRIEGLIRLAAGVAHEIGNPLNSIQIHLDLLKRETARLPRGKQLPIEKFLQVIASETRRLDQIVRSFLRATRQPPLRFRLDSLNEVLEEVVGFMRPEIQKQKVRVKLLLDKNLPRFLLDRDRLHEAFINLIKNGVEAMPQGGVLVISTSLKEKLCTVRFADEGAGIEERDLPHIFEAYYTTKPEGSGLGLTQVYQAVRDHGGRIDVKSEKEEGTVFTLLLPVRQERLSLPQPRGNGKRGNFS